MEPAQIAKHRLASQRLDGARLPTPEAVVEWLGAVQGQELPLALWSLGQRMERAVEADVSSALADGRILRTHVLRPTWHFVTPDDIRWIVGLTAPRVLGTNAYWERRFGLEERDIVAGQRVLRRTLRDANHLTRPEIAAELARRGIAVAGPQLAYLLMRSELDLVICSGAPKGRVQTYALVEERAPNARLLEADEALAELTRRYFTSRGPATLRDYTWWSSLTMAQARRGIELAASALERFAVDGRTYWFAPGVAATAMPDDRAHLVQGLDESVIAYSESRDALDGAGLARAHRRDERRYVQVAIIDAQLAGFWRRSLARGRLSIDVQLLRRLDRSEQRALESAADRYRAFAGAEALDLHVGGGNTP